MWKGTRRGHSNGNEVGDGTGVVETGWGWDRYCRDGENTTGAAGDADKLLSLCISLSRDVEKEIMIIRKKNAHRVKH